MKIKHQFKVHSKNGKKKNKNENPAQTLMNRMESTLMTNWSLFLHSQRSYVAQLSCYQPMRMQEREQVHDGLRSVRLLVLLSITFGLCSKTEQKEDEHLQLTEICIIL